MNAFTLRHKLENFTNELGAILKETLEKSHTKDEAQRLDSRIEFLEEELRLLRKERTAQMWAAALSKPRT
jgi:hypothetical protein